MRLLGAAAVAAVMGMCASAPASATTVTWDLTNPAGPLGATQAYTSNGYTIVASSPNYLYGNTGGGDESGLGTDQHDAYADIIKAQYDSAVAYAQAYYNTQYPQCGTDQVCQAVVTYIYTNQVNQATVDYSSGTNGIYFTYNYGYKINAATSIQIDVSQALSQGITQFQFEMGDSAGEEWSVYGLNSTGPDALLTPLYVNQTNELMHDLSGYTYYDFYYSGPDNPPSGVLLSQFEGSSASPVPEPSTWAMLLIGFAGLGYAGFKRSSKTRHALA
jgi:hypothetical protein